MLATITVWLLIQGPVIDVGYKPFAVSPAVLAQMATAEKCTELRDRIRKTQRTNGWNLTCYEAEIVVPYVKESK